MVAAHAAAASDIGKVRSNNQDSGYVGVQLFVVADGMGGHAGGDVASALTTKRLRYADVPYDSEEDAGKQLQDAVTAASIKLSNAVEEHPELTGMGTTVVALHLTGNRATVAHIGDSRVYRVHDGEVAQVTTDHTFVQHLVDAGRITEAEAAVHPRRSVLMRVLGDSNASPEVDLLHFDAVPGDRWLLCSDGLSGVVDHDEISRILKDPTEPEEACARLVRAALAGGAPDNVTAVVVDIVEDVDPTEKLEPQMVGSAASPISYDAPSTTGAMTRVGRIPALRLHVGRQASSPSHFESQAEEYLDALIAEDRRRAIWRRVIWLTGIVVLLGALALAAFGAYQWSQTRYYVGVSETGNVAIFQGVQQQLGPISLSQVYEESAVQVDRLPYFDRQQVQDTINATSLQDAQRILSEVTRGLE